MDPVLIHGGLIVSCINEDFETLRVWEDDILIEDGYIVCVGRIQDRKAKIVDAHGKIVLPGFVNSHCHSLATVIFRGLLAGYNQKMQDLPTNKSLLRFIHIILSSLSSKEIESLARLAILEHIAAGTTTIVEHCAIPAIEPFRQMSIKAGLRTELVQPLFIYDFSKDAYCAPNKLIIERLMKEHSLAWLGPYASGLWNPNLLQILKETVSNNGRRIIISLPNTAEELNLFEQTYHLSPIRFLAKAGLLGPHLILVHCLPADREEQVKLKETKTYVVHCVQTDTKKPSLTQFYNGCSARSNVAVGTGCYSTDILSELKAAAILGKFEGLFDQVTATNLFYAATVGGAKALGRDNLGRIAKGYMADIVILNSMRVGLRPIVFPLVNMILQGNTSDIETVIVNGQIIKEGRNFYCHEEQVIQEAEKVILKSWALTRANGLL